MKTALVLLLNFLFFIPRINAQMMMIGARAAVNLANEKYDNLPSGESISSRILFFGGAQVDYRFTNSIGISFQLLYDQKGSHAGMDSYPTMSIADWTIVYIEAPILLKVYFGNSSVRPYLFGGPSIGFLLRNTESLQSSSFFANGPVYSSYHDTVANITDSTAKFDISIIAGAGVSITLASGLELFLDAGYAFGLNNIDYYYADKTKGYYIYSRDIRIAAGILFPI